MELTPDQNPDPEKIGLHYARRSDEFDRKAFYAIVWRTVFGFAFGWAMLAAIFPTVDLLLAITMHSRPITPHLIPRNLSGLTRSLIAVGWPISGFIAALISCIIAGSRRYKIVWFGLSIFACVPTLVVSLFMGLGFLIMLGWKGQ